MINVSNTRIKKWMIRNINSQELSGASHEDLETTDIQAIEA